MKNLKFVHNDVSEDIGNKELTKSSLAILRLYLCILRKKTVGQAIISNKSYESHMKSPTLYFRDKYTPTDRNILITICKTILNKLCRVSGKP